MNRIALLLFIAGLFAAGCYYDVEEELYPSNCNTDTVTYSAAIAPIISTNCLVCHSTAANEGGVRLEGYDAIKTWINNGRLLGSIRREPGFFAMPKDSPKMSACNIAKIEKWVADGAPNN